MGLQIDDDGNIYDDGVDDGNSENEITYPGYAGDPVPNFAGGESQDHDFTKAEAEALWKAGAWDQAKGIVAKFGKDALNLFKDKNGGFDLGKLLTIGGGLLAANRPNNVAPTGYQGKIPKLTATSNMLTAPPVGRRPGSGGINYGGGATFRDEKGNIVSSNEKTLEELRQAAINNPFNQGASYSGNTGLGQSDLVTLFNQLNPPGGSGSGGGSGGGAGGGSSGVTVGGGIPGRGPDTRPTVSAGTVDQGYSRNYSPAEIQAIRANFLQNQGDPKKLMGLMTEYGVSVNDIANAMGGSPQGYQNIMLQAGADPSFGGMSDYKPTANDKSYIDYMLTQPNPLGQGTLADVYKKQGIDPYTDPRVITQAREQNQRFDTRNDLYGGTLDVNQGAAWQNPNWQANQNAAAAATAQRGQAQAAQDALSGVSVGGGAPAPAPAPAPAAAPATNANDWAQSDAGQAAGGINSVYNSINQFLSTNPSQEALQSAMQQYGVDQSTLDAAKAYGIQDFAKGGLARNGFVLPADVVSHFGNGSSEAGLKLLASKMGATPIKGDGDGMSDSIPTKIDGVQEARVANDEAYISPEMVAKLGNGSPEKGARKLYAMMDKIRKARTGSTEQGKEIDPNKYMPGGSVQRYVEGGKLPTGATGAESSLSNWAGDYVTNMLGQGQALANAPYKAYTGPLTAGASQLQNQGFNMAGNLRTPGSIGQAAGTAGGIANLAANMRYTPQTTDFLGGANMSGLGMSPSYGMGMPQQPPTEGTYGNPIPMPRGNDNPKFLGHGPATTGEYTGGFDEPIPVFDTSIDYGPDPLQKQRPSPADGGMLQTRPMREYGGSQYDPATGMESRDIVKLQPGDPRLESTNFQTKPFQGVMSEPFMQDGAMTGGVMQPPQAGIPGALPQASQQVGNIAQQYMNPYLESALRPQMAEMQRAADIARMSDSARLTQAGAFGGSRQAIMESEGRRNLLSKQSEALGQGYATAYDKAMQQFNADQARRAQEAQFGASFGLQGLQAGLQGAQTQAQAGALQSQADLSNLRGTLEAGGIQRGIESEGIAADKAQFEEARLNPYKMVQFQQSLLSGLPLAAQSYNVPGQSNLQQFAGGATTIQQLLDILSGKTTAAKK